MVFKDVIFFTYIYTYILFLIMRVLQNAIEDQNYLEEVVKPVGLWEKQTPDDPKDSKA